MKVLITTLSPYLPFSILDFMYDYSPGEGLALTRENRTAVLKAAKDLVESKIRGTGGGKSSRDILTLLGTSVSRFPIEVSF